MEVRHLPTNQMSLFGRLVAAALVGVGLFFTVAHMRYLNSHEHPSTAELRNELTAARAALRATQRTPTEVTDKGVFVAVEQRVQFMAQGSADTQKRVLAAQGWRYAGEDGVGYNYCKRTMVLTVSAASNGQGSLQVTWGKADAVCQ